MIKKLLTVAITSAMMFSIFMLSSNSLMQASLNAGGASASVSNQTAANVMGDSVTSSLGLSAQIGL